MIALAVVASVAIVSMAAVLIAALVIHAGERRHLADAVVARHAPDLAKLNGAPQRPPAKQPEQPGIVDDTKIPLGFS